MKKVISAASVHTAHPAAHQVHLAFTTHLLQACLQRAGLILKQMHNDQRSAGLVLQSMSVHGNNYHSSPQLPPGLLPAHTNSSLVASPARWVTLAAYPMQNLHSNLTWMQHTYPCRRFLDLNTLPTVDLQHSKHCRLNLF